MWRRGGPEVVEATVAAVWFAASLGVWWLSTRPRPRHRNRGRVATVVLEWVGQHR
jgi:hypothetical protein